ncbi:MAG: histidine kinase [Anaerolineales bacterium]|nr:histidine kinase [Anaerolineales bacterium]
MRRSRTLWYGGAVGEALAAILPALPFGLGVGYLAGGRYLESLVTSLSISLTVFALLKLDIAYIHPLFQKLPPNRAVLMEVISGLSEHALGTWLAFTVCNFIFGGVFQSKLAWMLAGGTLAAVMILHAFTYTMYSHAEIKRKIAQEQQLRSLATEAELKALKAQINPHFLFNTLNTIAALIHTDPPRAEATVERLAEIFRYALANSERNWAPLSEELAFVDGYLEIEAARFGERLRVNRQVDPQALDALVPGLILQPLVENAIRHGVSQDGVIDLSINVRLCNTSVEISVADQGPGMPANFEIGAQRGYGLNNVQERLTRVYGPAYGLQISGNQPQGAVVALKIPLGEKG